MDRFLMGAVIQMRVTLSLKYPSHADQGVQLQVGEVWTKECIKETFFAAESLTDRGNK